MTHEQVVRNELIEQGFDIVDRDGFLGIYVSDLSERYNNYGIWSRDRYTSWFAVATNLQTRKYEPGTLFKFFKNGVER